MNKNPPTEQQLKQQKHAAIMLAIAAVLDGCAMVLNFSPTMVLVEIGLVACAILQWNSYLNLKIRMEFHALINQEEKT